MLFTRQSPDLNAVLELLSSDRPTTFMLEEIVQTKLAVRVFQQEVFGADQCPLPEALKHVAGESESVLLYRHTGLFTTEGLQVSENRVVATLDLAKEVLNELHAGHLPIIHILQKYKLNQSRTILSFGKKQVRFADQDVFACYKEYLIHSDVRPILYLQEVFAPDLIQFEQTV